MVELVTNFQMGPVTTFSEDFQSTMRKDLGGAFRMAYREKRIISPPYNQHFGLYGVEMLRQQNVRFYASYRDPIPQHKKHRLFIPVHSTDLKQFFNERLRPNGAMMEDHVKEASDSGTARRSQYLSEKWD